MMIREGPAVEQKRIVLSAVKGNKLIHDSATRTNKFIFGALT